jgi:cob(I)alamin adenosyltransferase
LEKSKLNFLIITIEIFIIIFHTIRMKNGNELINPNFDKIGYIQVYTGDGKGKTTASLGLAMRALGRGWHVLIIFFTKGGSDYGELFAFRELSPKLSKHLTIIQAGLDRIVYEKNKNEEDRRAVREGFEFAKKMAQEGQYQLIIMDEANIAIDLDLISVEEMKDFLLNKPKELEVVLTGRHANPEIVELAHLVSEIKPIKHYWDIGVSARKGIEY